MKKLQLKLRKKTSPNPPTRITNDTVAEHRERILAGGRRYKYPLQYARHKLVFNAIILGVVAVVVFSLITLQQLYMAQTTSNFFYRITSFVPLSVASVDGAQVRYSDYLMGYNGSSYYLEQSQQVDPGTPDGKAQLQHLKRESLTNAEKYTYAAKLAKELQVTVTESDVSDAVNQNRLSFGDVSEQAYYASSQNIYGWTQDEVRRTIAEGLMIQKVKLKLDTDARKTTNSIATQLKEDPSKDFNAITEAVNKSTKTPVQVGGSGNVPLTNVDGGLSQAAAKLSPGQVSSMPVVSTKGTGYYFVRLNTKTDTKISYSYIQVPLTKFDTQFEALRKDGKIKEYISVKNA